jgi:hypothetical protein
MNMQHTTSDRIEMNIMWIAMGVMFIFDLGMIYYHVNMHKRVKALEAQLKNQK